MATNPRPGESTIPKIIGSRRWRPPFSLVNFQHRSGRPPAVLPSCLANRMGPVASTARRPQSNEVNVWVRTR